MSHPDPKPFLIPALLAVCAFGGPSGALLAQEAEPAQQQARFPTVSLEFGGGSLRDFAAAVRKAGRDVNIVVPALAEKVAIPALTLTDAGVQAALSAAGAVTTSDYSVHVEELKSPTGLPVYAVTVIDRSVRGNQTGTATTQPVRMDVVRVFSLKGLTDPVSGEPMGPGTTIAAKTILTAIDTGLQLQVGGREPKAEIRYHEDSGLLFVHGTRAQAEMVREVLSNLEHDVDQCRDATRRAAAEKARREALEQTAPPAQAEKRSSR